MKFKFKKKTWLFSQKSILLGKLQDKFKVCAHLHLDKFLLALNNFAVEDDVKSSICRIRRNTLQKHLSYVGMGIWKDSYFD